MSLIIGLLFAIPLILSAISGNLTFWWLLAVSGLTVGGLIVPRIIGPSLVTIQWASAASVFISIFVNDGNAIVISAVLFLITFGGQHLIAAIRLKASASVGAYTPPLTVHSSKFRKSSSKTKSNYEPGYWHHRSDFMEHGEIPLGQVHLGYQLLPEAVDRYQKRMESLGSKSKFDPWFRWLDIRYTDCAIYISNPVGHNIGETIPHVFAHNERVAYSNIDSMTLSYENSEYAELEIHIKSNNLTVRFDVAMSQEPDARCLVGVWNASDSVFPYYEMGEVTQDPRMKWLGEVSSKPIENGTAEEVTKFSRQWAEISEKLFDEQTGGRQGFLDMAYLKDFAFSNCIKLNKIADPKSAIWYIFSEDEEPSFVHRDFTRAFSLNFEETLPDVERIYSNGTYTKPKNFDVLVSRTREILNCPRGKALFDS
jgi:hypothetical protein